MNIDTLSPQLPPVAQPARSVHTPPDQASNRPVERPHHGEAADNQNRNGKATAETEQEVNRKQSDQERPNRQQPELSPEEQRELEKLKGRDREVRAHEAAHKNAAGHLARGSAQFDMETGPDGRRYAVGGEVSIDTSKVSADPEATLRKAQVIRRAAHAPVEPSAQDLRVAAEASRMEAQARVELGEQRGEENAATDSRPGTGPSASVASLAEPTPVGTLLDVII